MNPDELKQQLSELEKQLRAAVTAEAKAEIERQIKDLQTKIPADNSEKVKSLETELTTTKTELTETKDKLAKVIDAQDKMLAEKNHKPAAAENKSFQTLLGEGIKENLDGMKEIILKRSPGLKFSFDLKAAGDMSFSANASTIDVATTTLRPGIIALPNRKVHVRQLLPTGTMTGSTFTFLREKTTGEGNPATVSEGNWKEQFDIDYEEVDAPSQYIAGYLVCSTKMFDDVPGLVSHLQMRLPEKLLNTEDVQLLYGDGNSPNLGGITKSGNFTAPNGAATIDELQLVEAIAQLEMLDREANGILVSPQDYYRIFEYTASSSGEFTYTRLSTIVNGQLYIGGVPLFRSTALTTDKFIVGDWNAGAQLITRDAPRVEIFYEDGNNVRRNQVTVRVEERVAFPVYGSNYFIYGDFGHS